MELLTQVINTLNTIEVKGFENMSKLMGCISALEEIQKQTKEKENEERKNEDM